MSKKEERLNLIRKTNEGKTATIIAYRNSNDIDIKFEDGVIVTHKKYANFIAGKIKYPKIGEKKKMYNNKYATIIAYRNSNDIDIEFEDGSIAYHKRYGDFVKGYIKHPTEAQKNNKKNERLNEVRTMGKYGKAKIIKYIDAHHIDVEFMYDKTVVRNRTYNSFVNGKINNPNIRIDKTPKLMKDGNIAYIESFSSVDNIDVRFNNGKIVHKETYQNFIEGNIKQP